MDGELIAFAVLILVMLAGLTLALLALLLLALSRIFGFWSTHRRKMTRTLAGAGIAIAVPLIVMFAAGMLSLPEPDPGDEKHLVAAARAKVKSEFRDPEKVQFQEVWLGKSRAFEKTVCGMVDSDEITNVSHFIFVTDPEAPPLRTPDGQQAGRERDRLSLEFPPTIEGSKPTDTAYWESVAREMSSFNYQWSQLCEKQRPGADESEGQ